MINITGDNSGAWRNLAKDKMAMMMIGAYIACQSDAITESDARPLVWHPQTIDATTLDKSSNVQLVPKSFMESIYPGGTRLQQYPSSFTLKKAQFLVYSVAMPMNLIGYKITFIQRGSNNPPPSGDVYSYRWGIAKAALFMLESYQGVQLPVYVSEDSVSISQEGSNSGGGSVLYMPAFIDYASSIKSRSSSWAVEGSEGITYYSGDSLRKLVLGEIFSKVYGYAFAPFVEGQYSFFIAVKEPVFTCIVTHPSLANPVVISVNEATEKEACNDLADQLVALLPMFIISSDGDVTLTCTGKTGGDLFTVKTVTTDAVSWDGAALISVLLGNVANNANEFIAFGPRYFRFPSSFDSDVSILPLAPDSPEAAVVLRNIVEMATQSYCTTIPFVAESELRK